MTRRRFDLIVFDWDGTLFDSTRLIARCIQSACADVGTAVPSDRDASFVIGLGLGDALRHAAPDFPRERYGELAERYRHHYLAQPGRDRPLRRHARDAARAEGAQPLARRRHRQDAARPRPGARRVAAGGLFDATRTADETRGKPDPLMLVELMRELGAARRSHADGRRHDARPAARRQRRLRERRGELRRARARRVRGHAPLHVAHSTADLAALAGDANG